MRKVIPSIIFLLLFQAGAFAIQPEKHILDNGLTLIIKEAPGTGLVAINTFIDASSLNESKKTAGMASMVGSMLQEGTKNRSAEALAEELENVGAALGVENSSDYTGVSYLSLSDNFELGLDILSDILINAAFPEKELNKQKEDAVAAIKQIDDHPNVLILDEVLGLLYQNHPYGFRAKQKIPNIKRFSRKDLVKFYNNYYIPSNMVVSIVGDINIDQIIKLSKTYFVFNRAGGRKKITKTPKIPVKNRSKTIKKSDLKASWLEISYLATPIESPDYPALKVLANILGSGMSSRLFVEIREKEALVYSIGSFFPSMKQKSNFTIYAVCSPDNLAKVKSMIFTEIKKIKSKKVSQSELQRAQNYLNGKFIISHQSLLRQAWYLGWFEAMGVGYQMDQVYKKDIDSVSADDILRVAKKYLNKHCMVILGPK
ncbi:MAG: insulinase family protein [Candidatus Saganbacteria bacterium]|nr:insulinase family protein [Candidatus Saganbacteria bacterium]